MEGNGNGHRTFAGGGFGTLVLTPVAGPQATPRVASERAYLRDALPALYQEGDFAMRFVGALETLLDPIVAVLDGLPAHFTPDHAPRDVLALLSAWLGVEADEALPLAHRRELVRRAAELGRRRGTRAGLELALRLSFPDLPLRVEDPGRVGWSADGELPEAAPAQVVVYCDAPVDETTAAAIARCIEEHKPVHVGSRLRVRRGAS